MQFIRVNDQHPANTCDDFIPIGRIKSVEIRRDNQAVIETIDGRNFYIQDSSELREALGIARRSPSSTEGQAAPVAPNAVTCPWCQCTRFYHVVGASQTNGGIYINTATVELECWNCGRLYPQTIPHYPKPEEAPATADGGPVL